MTIVLMSDTRIMAMLTTVREGSRGVIISDGSMGIITNDDGSNCIVGSRGTSVCSVVLVMVVTVPSLLVTTVVWTLLLLVS